MPTRELPILIGNRAFLLLTDVEALEYGSAFYQSLDPGSWILWIDAAMRLFEECPKPDHETLKDYSERDLRRQYATRARIAYGQLVEVFLAHFFANVQCPHAPSAWLGGYRTKDLRGLAKLISRYPWAVESHVPVLRHSDAFLAWLYGVDRLSGLSTDEREAEMQAIRRIITKAAADYADGRFVVEQNAVKHGGRVRSGGWTLQFTPTGQEGPTAAVASAYGSQLAYLKGLQGNVHVLRSLSTGWDVRADIRLCQLLAQLLHNLIIARSTPEPRQFYSFRNLDIDSALHPQVGVYHFDFGPEPDLAEELPDPEEILGWALDDLHQFAATFEPSQDEE